MKSAKPLRTRRVAIGYAAIATAFGIALTACGSGTNSEQIPVNGTENQVSIHVVEEVEAALGYTRDAIEFTDPVVLSPSTCVVHGAWPTQVLDVAPRYFAQLPNGEVIQGPAEGAAQAALTACFDDTGHSPTADSVADTVLRLDPTPLKLQLLTPNMATFLEPYGIAYQEPQLVENEGTTVTTFFANDFEVVGVLQVTATRLSDGTLMVDYAELG